MKVAQIKEVPHNVQGLQEQIKELENKVSALEDKFASQQAKDVFKNVQTVAGKTLIAAAVKVSGMNQLRSLADQWKEKSLSDVLVLGSASGDKVSLIVAASDDAIKSGIKAGDLIKAIAPLVGGGGGGRPNLAQAGGKKPEGLPEALKAAEKWLAEK